MSAKRLFLWLLLLFGEAVLVAAFVLFRGETPDNIFVLNMAVSSVVYALFFLNYHAPWIDLKDKSQKQIGAIGIRWFAVWFYAILAVAVMLVANLAWKFAFDMQLIVHCGLLFLLLLGFWISRHASDKVKGIYEQERANRNGIAEMKQAMSVLKDKIDETSGLPDTFIQQVNALEESLRFISPIENGAAHELERYFVEVTNEIKFALPNFLMNEEQINSNLKKLERIYYNRKSIYSN